MPRRSTMLSITPSPSPSKHHVVVKTHKPVAKHKAGRRSTSRPQPHKVVAPKKKKKG